MTSSLPVQRIARDAIPRVDPRAFRTDLIGRSRGGARLLTLYGQRDGDAVSLTAVYRGAAGAFELLRTVVDSGGTERPVVLSGRGAVIGLFRLFDKPLALGIVATVPTTLCEIPIAVIRQLPAWPGPLQTRAAELAFTHFQNVARWSAALRQEVTAARIASCLVMLQRDSGELPLPTHAELPSWIEGDRRILVGSDVAPLAIVPPRPQIPALPLYDQAIAGVQERLADLPPWLAVAGNYLGRLGVAKLLDVARESAARIDDNLPPRH